MSRSAVASQGSVVAGVVMGGRKVSDTCHDELNRLTISATTLNAEVDR